MKQLLVVALAGCGRLGFDEQSTTTSDGSTDGARLCSSPVGHDEDADGTDDACDVCPHLAGAQTDGDGDNVGDACDPEPAIARQSIVLFDPFTTLDPAWAPFNGASVSNDELVLDARNTAKQIVRPYTANTDTFLIGMTTGDAGAGQYNFAIVTAPVAPPGGFYCELFDASGSTATATIFTWTFDNASYMHAGAAGWPGGSHFANGSGTFSYALSPTAVSCQSVWQGTPQTAGGSRPAISVEELHLYAENVDVRISYFIQIRTN